jgi:hypothetical protein
MLLFSSAAANSFSAGNATSDSLFNLAVDMTSVTTAMSTPSAGGTLTINSQDLGSYDYVVKQGNQTLTSFTAADWFTTTPDTRSSWIVVNGNLTINSGLTFTPTVRKLFTCIYVAGNLQLDGTISMSARGANHSGTGNSNGYTLEKDIRIITGTYSSVVNPQIPAIGGAAGKPGASPTDGGTGGGGNGGDSGTTGTAFTGGVGGGSPSGVAASVGRGGKGADSYENPDGLADPNTYGSGAGNPGGGGSRGTAGTGTGGTLIVFVRGTLSGSGSFTSIGAAGGSGSSIGPARRFSHGGGGTGGGSINIFRATDTSSTSVITTGGAGGPGDSIGGGGGYSDPGGTGGSGTGRKLTF